MNATNTINTTNKQSCLNKIALIEYAFDKVKNSKKRKDLKYDIIGLSSYINQEFLEIICADKKVLEIGTYCGASTIPIMKNAVSVITVDNFEENEIIAVDENIHTYCDNPLQEFKNNIQKFVPDKNYTLLQNNIFDISTYSILKNKTFDVIFYDASHKLEDILKFFIMYRKLIENSILIIDDYNFKSVQEAIEITQSKKIIKIQKIFKVITDAESRNDFWNGICVII